MLLDSISPQQHPVNRYSKLKGIINPYNWGPYLDNSLTRPGVGIYSRDILSTTTINLGYLYDTQEHTGSWHSAVSYQGLFPIIDVQVSQGDRSVNEGQADFYDTLSNPVSIVSKDVIFTWKEKNIEAGFRIPLTTTQSRFMGNFTIGNSAGVTKVYDFRNNIDGGGRIIPVTDTSAYFFRSHQDNGSLLYNHFSPATPLRFRRGAVRTPRRPRHKAFHPK